MKNAVVCSLSAILLASAPALALDGGTPETLALHASTLASVFKVEIARGTADENYCTASKIGDKILILDKHCFTYRRKIHEKDGGGTRVVQHTQEGDTIYLNDQPYELAGIRMPKALAPDLAVIRVEATGLDVLKAAPSLRLANASDLPSLSRELLVAGVGKESVEETAPETAAETRRLRKLNAGIQTRIDRRDEIRPAAFLPEDFWISRREVKPGEFWIVSQRVDKILLRQRVGDRFSDLRAGLNRTTVKTDGAPVILPGDSGGPAIAYDAAGNPSIVGVAEAVRLDYGFGANRLVVHGDLGELVMDRPVGSNPGNESESFVENLTGDISGALLETGFLRYLPEEKDALVLKNYRAIELVPQVIVGSYTSVTDAKIRAFIDGAVSELKSR